MDLKALGIFLLMGLIAGFLAGLIVGGGGLFSYLIWGVLGSFVGGFLFEKLGVKLNFGNDMIRQIITSTVGAIIVVVLARIIA